MVETYLYAARLGPRCRLYSPPLLLGKGNQECCQVRLVQCSVDAYRRSLMRVKAVTGLLRRVLKHELTILISRLQTMRPWSTWAATGGTGMLLPTSSFRRQ